MFITEKLNPLAHFTHHADTPGPQSLPPLLTTTQPVTSHLAVCPREKQAALNSSPVQLTEESQKVLCIQQESSHLCRCPTTISRQLDGQHALAIVLDPMQTAEKVQDLRKDPNMFMLTTSYWKSFRLQKMLKESSL